MALEALVDTNPAPLTTHAPARYIVQTAAARMPASCWGRYRRAAVLEIDLSALPSGRTAPAMISTRARGVSRVVQTWERLHVGTTDHRPLRLCCGPRRGKGARRGAQYPRPCRVDAPERPGLTGCEHPNTTNNHHLLPQLPARLPMSACGSAAGARGPRRPSQGRPSFARYRRDLRPHSRGANGAL